METGKMKLALSAGAVALSMALAGCGGGSSSGPTSASSGATPRTPTTFDRTTCTTESGTPYVNVGVTACVASCANGVNDAGDQCLAAPTERNKLGATNAEALKDAIRDGFGSSEGTRVLWSAATGVAIINRTTVPKFIGPTANRIELAKDDTTVAPLGNWKGSDQSGKHSSGTSAMLRVYSNQEDAKKASIGIAHLEAALFGASDSIEIDAGAYDIIAAAVGTGADGVRSKNITGDNFPAVGEGPETYTSDEEKKIKGTYKGASGEYSCSSSTPCSAEATTDGIVFRTGSWKFKPDSGAMVEIKDASYLQFGWWVHKDAADAPTNADVFYALKTPSSGGITAETRDAIIALTGTATYKGYAAGKFAVYHSTEDINESGHFTADAMLKATFGTNAAGTTMTGTIDNFKLNDGTQNPNWRGASPVWRW